MKVIHKKAETSAYCKRREIAKIKVFGAECNNSEETRNHKHKRRRESVDPVAEIYTVDKTGYKQKADYVIRCTELDVGTRKRYKYSRIGIAELSISKEKCYRDYRLQRELLPCVQSLILLADKFDIVVTEADQTAADYHSGDACHLAEAVEFSLICRKDTDGHGSDERCENKSDAAHSRRAFLRFMPARTDIEYLLPELDALQLRNDSSCY